MGERSEKGEPAKPPCLHRFLMIPLLVFVLSLLFVLGTIFFTSFRLQAFSSSTPKDFETVSRIFKRLNSLSSENRKICISHDLHCVSGEKGSDFDRVMFIFGDSYADIGNLPHGPAMNYPYGVTWPGYPVGRFSNGYIQADFLATQVLGRPSPPAFEDSTASSLSQGVNFAFGGSTLVYNIKSEGAPMISTQVTWLEAIINSGLYTKDVLASSVTLLCISGNDYGYHSGPVEEYFIKEVVGLMEKSLRKLHSLGLKNIMVTTVAAMDCLPYMTESMNFTACYRSATLGRMLYHHNSYLEKTLVNLSNDLSGVNFILLRQDDAIRYILTNPTLFNISHPYKNCCFGKCGRVDNGGNLLYTTCKNPEIYAWWDDGHPTHAGWQHVVSLYATNEAFTALAPNLKHWVENLL